MSNPGIGTCVSGNPVTPLQHQLFDMLVAMGENDTYQPAYTYSQNIGDGRGYTNGKVGFCTGTGDAITVARCYNDAKPSNALSVYWPGFVSINNTFFNTGSNQGSTTAIDNLKPSGHQFPNTNPTAIPPTGGDWAAAAADPVFNACQDSMADAFYLSLALYHANALHLTAPLTVGFLYDTELNFGEEDESDNPGTATLISQSLTDYQKTYGSAFPSSSPSAAQEQALLGCFLFERAYDMANNSTWKEATDQNATWESARRGNNMNMSSAIYSKYYASYTGGGVTACWTGLPSNVNSGYTTYEVYVSGGQAVGTIVGDGSGKASCPSTSSLPSGFQTICHR